MKKNQKEFLENRTSWKFFQRHLESKNGIPTEELKAAILLEILKELQHLCNVQTVKEK